MQLRSVAFLTLAATAVSLASVSAVVGAQRYRHQVDTYRALAGERANARRPGVVLDGAGVEPALRVLRPTNAIMALVSGVDPAAPDYWDIGPAGVRRGWPVPSTQGAEEGPPIDYEVTVRVVLGLLAVLLAVEAVAGDRERGTLAALMAQPVPAEAVFAAKAAGVTSALIVALALMSGVVLAALAFAAPELVTASNARDLAAIDLCGLTYLVALAACGLLLASSMRSSRGLLAAGVVVWAFVALVAPQLMASIARLALAPTHEAAVEDQEQRTYDEMSMNAAVALGDVYARQGPTRAAPPSVPPDIDAGWLAAAAGMRRAVDQVGLDEIYVEEHRERLKQALTLVSPGSAFARLTYQIAAADAVTRIHWEWQVLSYETRMGALLFDNPPRIALRLPGAADDAPQTLVRLDRYPPRPVADYPTFEMQRPAFAERVNLSDCGVLLIYAVAILAWAKRAFAGMNPLR